MSAWTVYWILKLDAISFFLSFVGLLGSAAGVALFIFMFINLAMNKHYSEIENKTAWDISEARDSNNRYMIAKRLTPVAIIMFVLFTISVFIPSTNQMATIIVAPKIINNEQIQQMPEKLLELGNTQLDKWIEEAKDDITK